MKIVHIIGKWNNFEVKPQIDSLTSEPLYILSNKKLMIGHLHYNGCLYVDKNNGSKYFGRVYVDYANEGGHIIEIPAKETFWIPAECAELIANW